ncbi:MAG: ABC transporter permease subunit [Phycisphaerales bacterium]|nr:ABC transporter permease subunit [Phycisphaerales bacterium]
MATITGKPDAFSPPGRADAGRFQASRSIKIVDSVMSVLIRAGGVGVIVAVLAIFLFILWQILPLFRGASVELLSEHDVPAGTYAALATDEWSELPALIAPDGRITFVDLVGGRPPQTDDLAETLQSPIAALRLVGGGNLVVATADRRLAVVHIGYHPEFKDDVRTIVADVDAGAAISLGIDAGRVVALDYGDSGDRKVAVVIVETDGRRSVRAVTMRQRRSLTGSGKTVVDSAVEIDTPFDGEPLEVLASSRGDSFLVRCRGGTMYSFVQQEGGFGLHQRFVPFEDAPSREISLAQYIFGDVSLALVNSDGLNRVFSLFRPEDNSPRLWGLTKEFPPLAGAGDLYAKSVRNKTFLVGSGDEVSLRYSTTESIRWQETLPFRPTLATISGKNDRIVFLDDQDRLHVYRLDDPHAESSWRAFFGKIWYEGASEPRFEWQSTGGSDEFEPKLSMVPLIFGTLKGTFFALLLALPIALAAAVYTSQFAHYKVRAIVKPVMEIMASLPSVVLGFLGALWLAPILETRVPTVLVLLALVPVLAMLVGWLWPKVPLQVRNRMGLFGELAVLTALLAAAFGLALVAGPLLERVLFVTTDPHTGQRVADFRDWWRHATGLDFQQRNSMIVGFMMGFAVIPIIFTIAEDALSNVPQNLRSGSLALGATRWQTAMRVVVPTASAGIFSALMVGLGRAVGETMIVLMATGNTPIMEWNVFSGMRTLSANIAVELPEAPHHGTLFRALYLGAMLLFLMTFVVNTVAEVLRQHLRNRYKTV